MLSGVILVITQFAGLTINQNQPTFVWNVHGPPWLCRKVKHLKEIKHLGQIPDGAILITDVADVRSPSQYTSQGWPRNIKEEN